ncbi:hypothetical protein [Methylophaga sp.]|uniref:hypothetical protein n=1 Tax=Methylophaga sp. TaxID=2024840 RepID=UPI0023B64F84
MLTEEQVVELLRRCELCVGHRLNMIRGNLINAETRSAAIWELLVLEEASRHGTVEYEPLSGASPDILINLKSGGKIWIEVAFLYGRFWKQERQSMEVINWLNKEVSRRNIDPAKVSYRFDGNNDHKAGPVRVLPGSHQKKIFLNDPELRRFYLEIEKHPDTVLQFKHSAFSIELTYNPKASISFSGGLVQEVPTDIKQHSVYRLLKEKARQHSVDEPRIVCIGTDQNRVLSDTNTHFPEITLSQAIGAGFMKSSGLSAVITVSINDVVEGLSANFFRRASSKIFLNPDTKVPLMEKDVSEIKTFNFNRWNYSFRLEKFEPESTEPYRRNNGNLTMRTRGTRVIFDVPTNLVVDALAGKSNLQDVYRIDENDNLVRCFNDGWIIKSCSLKKGNIEQGEPDMMTLELEPPFPSVLFPKKI